MERDREMGWDRGTPPHVVTARKLLKVGLGIFLSTSNINNLVVTKLLVTGGDRVVMLTKLSSAVTTFAMTAISIYLLYLVIKRNRLSPRECDS